MGDLGQQVMLSRLKLATVGTVYLQYPSGLEGNDINNPLDHVVQSDRDHDVFGMYANRCNGVNGLYGCQASYMAINACIRSTVVATRC